MSGKIQFCFLVCRSHDTKSCRNRVKTQQARDAADENLSRRAVFFSRSVLLWEHRPLELVLTCITSTRFVPTCPHATRLRSSFSYPDCLVPALSSQWLAPPGLPSGEQNHYQQTDPQGPPYSQPPHCCWSMEEGSKESLNPPDKYPTATTHTHTYTNRVQRFHLCSPMSAHVLFNTVLRGTKGGCLHDLPVNSLHV